MARCSPIMCPVTAGELAECIRKKAASDDSEFPLPCRPASSSSAASDDAPDGAGDSDSDDEGVVLNCTPTYEDSSDEDAVVSSQRLGRLMQGYCNWYCPDHVVTGIDLTMADRLTWGKQRWRAYSSPCYIFTIHCHCKYASLVLADPEFGDLTNTVRLNRQTLIFNRSGLKDICLRYLARYAKNFTHREQENAFAPPRLPNALYLSLIRCCSQLDFWSCCCAECGLI